MRLYELFQKEDKDNVTTLKPQTKGTKYPLFSKENAQKAYNEYYHGADVDRDIKIVGKDNKEYVIRQNRDGDSQHFDPGHWYLTDANNKIVDFESYPDPGELLHYHMASDFYRKDPDEVEENFADGKKKGKSRPGRVKRSGASCKGSVTSLRAKAKKYSGERGKMYHWCANMKGGKKKKKTNEGLFDEMPLPTWMSHTSLEKMFRQEYGDRYGDYLAYMDLDSDDDAAMSSDFGDMALDIAKDHDIKEMNKFLSQMPVQFKVDDLRLDQGIQVWHLVQQPTTVH